MSRWNTIYYKQEHLHLHQTIAKLKNSRPMFFKIRLYKWHKWIFKMILLFLKLEPRAKVWKDQILDLRLTQMRLNHQLRKLQVISRHKPINQRISIQKAYLKLKRLSKVIWGFYKSFKSTLMIQDLVTKAHQQRLTCLDKSTIDIEIKSHSMCQRSQDFSIAFLTIHQSLFLLKIKARSKTKILSQASPTSFILSMFFKQIAQLTI